MFQFVLLHDNGSNELQRICCHVHIKQEKLNWNLCACIGHTTCSVKTGVNVEGCPSAEWFGTVATCVTVTFETIKKADCHRNKYFER